jgi:hypothetical protein
MINYDADRGINVSSEAGKALNVGCKWHFQEMISKFQFSPTDFHYSELTIQHTTKNHSGNYSCFPSNAQPASVVVHIFKGNLN